MLETYADRPLTTQLTVKRDFIHSEIGASADLRMDKVHLRDAQIYQSGASPQASDKGILWRDDLDAVDGFSLGRLSLR